MYQPDEVLHERSPNAPELPFCEGGCACGAVRYSVASAPLIVHACHCRLCQRQTGSTNAVNALIEADRVTLKSGDLEQIVLPTPSGRGQVIWRCADCKGAVWSNYLINNQEDNIRFLRVGTLDHPERMPPDVHIYTSTKLPWFAIPEDHLAVDIFYDFDSTWSAGSKSRLDALTRRTTVRYK